MQHCASETTNRVGTVGGATAEQSSPSLAPLSDNRRRLSHPVSTEPFSFRRGDREIEPRSHHSAIPILLLASKLMQRAHTQRQHGPIDRKVDLYGTVKDQDKGRLLHPS